MGREVAPLSQWTEPHPTKIVALNGRLYPALYSSNVWGWTDRASEADGIIETAPGTSVLGVDDSTVTGGARVFDLGNSGQLIAIEE